jgi:prepilin-type N-terminal cleavage/methylation domain-containing protein
MRLRHAIRDEQGFTLVEVLTAATLAAVGVAATLGVFGSSQRASVVSQRKEVAVQQAQAAMDRMQLMEYADLKLSTLPVHHSDPQHPFNKVVNTTQLQVKTGLTEDLIVDTDQGQVFVGPERFDVGSGSSQMSGYIYRFITWRDENCPTGTCDGSQNTKRLTVAVTVDGAGAIAQRAPVWITSVTADPNAAPPGSDLPPNANPGSGNGEAETFYLYDTRCSQTSRSTITGHHSTHNTSSRGAASIDYSTCENADLTKRPDLMGTGSIPGDASTALYKYSNDLTGTYPGGLAMKNIGSSCPTSYLAADSTNLSVPNQWNVHTWATNQFTSTFTLSGRVVVQLYTQTLDAVPASGMICATLVSRSTSNGVPTDTVLGSSTYTNSTWPTSPTPLTFTWDLPSSVNITSNRRLLLVISARGESDADLVMLYDHPSYQSFLQVATTTPLP